MKKEIPHDLIERYLIGTLSETEHLQASQRLATDAGFRAEVELQRAIQTHLGDTGEVRLRAALDSILYSSLSENPQSVESPSARHKNSNWLRLVGLPVLLIIIGFAFWKWWSHEKPAPAPPTSVQEPVQEPAAPEPSTDTIPAPTQNPAKQDSPKQPQPMAMANPADFTPNPVLDARINGVRGDDDTQVELVSPVSESEFLLESGYITLSFKGTVTTDSISANEEIRLFVYSNRPKDWENKQALFDLPFHFEPSGDAQYRVDFRQHLQLRPGLYYLVVGQKRRPEDKGGYRTLWVGKFRVKAKM